MSANYETLRIEQRGPLRIITIDRPKSMNALNGTTIGELNLEFDAVGSDESTRCVILTGSGEKAFVAGADIKELKELDSVSGKAFSERGLALMTTIQNCPKPVIAAINGFALGGGCELALACDIRLASEKAKLGQPEVNLGLIPGYGGTQRLSRLVGRGKGMQLVLTGALISAAEAHRIGLVDEIYPPDELMVKAIEMAELICAKAPMAVRLAKESINRGLNMSLTDGCDLEKNNFGVCCGSEDKSEGVAAFLEKRSASFTGK